VRARGACARRTAHVLRDRKAPAQQRRHRLDPTAARRRDRAPCSCHSRGFLVLRTVGWHGKRCDLSKHLELSSGIQGVAAISGIGGSGIAGPENADQKCRQTWTERSSNRCQLRDSQTLWMFSSRQDPDSRLLPRFSAQRNGSPTGASNSRATGSAVLCAGGSGNVLGHQPSRKSEDRLAQSGTLNTTRHSRAQRILPLNPIRLRPFP